MTTLKIVEILTLTNPNAENYEKNGKLKPEYVRMTLSVENKEGVILTTKVNVSVQQKDQFLAKMKAYYDETIEEYIIGNKQATLSFNPNGVFVTNKTDANGKLIEKKLWEHREGTHAGKQFNYYELNKKVLEDNGFIKKKKFRGTYDKASI